ncbi:MAG TPA: proprotein convertase P-domain-containing protein [Kofleriaceae bacterium]|nr:proprotein convertase P-domain-containing protein [Kofleriaceae bacterium]
MAACSVDAGGPGATCPPGGKCDAAGDVRGQLEGLDDPVARWLLESPMTEDGRLATDFMVAVEQVAKQMNCSMDTMRTFALSDDLVAGEPFPRLISTVCSDDDTRASEFFIAASFPDATNPHDVDVTNLEMFAWDSTARRYRFYATLPVEGKDEVQVEVEVRRCTQCHLNSKSLDDDGMPSLPIMNELTRPWPHWNAEPDFPSHTFDVATETRSAPHFAELTGSGRLASAALFEQIIRSAQSNRVVAARLRARRDPADVGQAMGLLRPLFCEEQVNYATEDFAAGVMPASTVVAGGTRDMFLAVRPSDWPWQWLNADVIRFDDASDKPLAMVPVRGAADVEYEKRLVSVKGLTAHQVLRIRALDWAVPVLSDLRCGLWKDARARLRVSPPDIPAGATNGDILTALYEETMKLDGQSLLVGAPEQVVALRDAGGRDALVAALAGGTAASATCSTGFCVTDLNGFGDLLDVRAQATEATGGRDRLSLERDGRLCVVERDFPNRPAFQGGVCRDLPSHASADVKGFGLESTGPPIAGENREVRLIPDGDTDGVASEIDAAAAGSAPADQVSVRVAIAHGWRGDLTVMLTAPSGATREVVSFDPADSGSDVDEAFFISFDPGETAGGTWTLTVIDAADGEQGFLEGWSLGVGGLAPSLDSPGARVAP